MMEGIVATSYSAGEKFFTDPAKLLPLNISQPKGQHAARGGGRGGRRSGRGCGGGFRGMCPPRRGGFLGGHSGGFRGRGRS